MSDINGLAGDKVVTVVPKRGLTGYFIQCIVIFVSFSGNMMEKYNV